MATHVTSKGQVTIPKPVRDAMGIRAGSAVEFTLDADGRAMMAVAGPEAPAPASRFARLRGIAGAGMSTDEIMRLTRDDVGEAG